MQEPPSVGDRPWTIIDTRSDVCGKIPRSEGARTDTNQPGLVDWISAQARSCMLCERSSCSEYIYVHVEIYMQIYIHEAIEARAACALTSLR